MEKCKIIIEQVGSSENQLGLKCSADIRGASMADKFMIMHTLARALELDDTDIMMYSLAESMKVFSSGTEVRLPLTDTLKEKFGYDAE